MIEIRDKTFDGRLFVNVLNIMDSYYLAQKMTGRDPEYYVENAGVNFGGYVHRIVLRNSDTNTGLSLFLYENQTLNWKGFLRFQIKDPEFNSREDTAFLRSIKIKKIDKKAKGERRAFAVYMDDIEHQLPSLVAHYSRYLL